jgi:hypothetical protein
MREHTAVNYPLRVVPSRPSRLPEIGLGGDGRLVALRRLVANGLHRGTVPDGPFVNQPLRAAAEPPCVSMRPSTIEAAEPGP